MQRHKGLLPVAGLLSPNLVGVIVLTSVREFYRPVQVTVDCFFTLALEVPRFHSHAKSFVYRKSRLNGASNISPCSILTRDSHVAQAILEIPAGEIRDDQVLRDAL